MQLIMQTPPDNEAPEQQKHRPLRIPIVSTNFYPLMVMGWVLSVATVGAIAAFFCTEFFQQYTALLSNLGNG